ncbi:MAG: response regulator [Ilumatobacteraceae bacterium]
MSDPDPIGVLIVDDHRMFAESLARLLSDEEGIEIVGVAVDGARALEMVTSRQPRVALVDYNLPEQDGITIAAAMKRLRPSTMVVMVTGSTEDRVLLGAIEAGCSGFITKDRAADEIAEVVRGAAAGEALISPALLARLLPRLQRSHRSLGDDLTERERDTLRYLARGWTNKVIATEMNLSLNTVRNYVQSVLTKLGAHSKLEAVSIAVREGLVDYPPRD